MRAIAKWIAVVSLLVVARGTLAQAPPAGQAPEQIPWVSDLKQAGELASTQNRLMLLHFYGDNCAPCERVEQQVFSQAKVVQAVARNYIPVKVHVGKSPEVAARYQVDRWPTDVICTPAGLEVQRSVSPQNPDEYVALIERVAQQAGVGAARQWGANPANLAAAFPGQAAAEAQSFANRVGTSANTYAAQANTYATQANAQANNYAAQVGAYANQVNAGAQNYANQGQQQLAQAGQQYNQAAQQANSTAGQAQQQWNDTSKQFQAAGQQAQGTAQHAAQDMRNTWNGAAANLRSAFTPPGAEHAVAAAPQPQPQPQVTQNVAPGPQQPQMPQPQVPAANPYVTQSPVSVAAAAEVAAPASAQQEIAGQPPVTPVLVPASQAPPTALEGYCPVTLLDKMKWIKADARFGAIHHGHTYLFATAADQQKFLSDPDRYCPVLDGFDPVRFATTGELVPGKRSCGLTINKKIYLFADEASLTQFAKNTKPFVDAAYQAMQRRETGTTLR